MGNKPTLVGPFCDLINAVLNGQTGSTLKNGSLLVIQLAKHKLLIIPFDEEESLCGGLSLI